MHMEKIFIENEGGHLACLVFDVSAPIDTRGTVIACHGFRGGKENGGRIMSLATKLNELGWRLLAFDFSGSGESGGDFSTITISRQVQDAVRIIDYVESVFKGRMLVLGRSLGGSTALALAARDQRPSGFILWSTPILVKETMSKILGENREFPVKLKDEYGDYELKQDFVKDLPAHDFSSYVVEAGRKPLLVIHGEDDELVEPKNASLIKELVPQAMVVTVPGADHRFKNRWRLREDVTIAWIKEYFS